MIASKLPYGEPVLTSFGKLVDLTEENHHEGDPPFGPPSWVPGPPPWQE